MNFINKLLIFSILYFIESNVFTGSSQSYITEMQDNRSTNDLLQKGRSFSQTRLLLNKINDGFDRKKVEVEKLISSKRDSDDSKKYNLIIEDSKKFKDLHEYFIEKRNSLEKVFVKIISMIEQQKDCLEKLRDGDTSLLYDFVNFALVSNYIIKDRQRLDLDKDFFEFKENANRKMNKTGKRLIFRKGKVILENYFSNLKYKAEYVKSILDEIKIILLRLDKFYLELLSRFGKKVTLPFAVLKEIYLVGADLRNSYLPGANFYNSRLMKTDFSESNLSNASFELSNAENAIFKNCDLTEANMSHVDLFGANFTKADLFKTNFLSSNLESTIFTASILEQANLNSVKAKKAKFDKANLKRAVLDNANLGGSSFRNAKLNEASLKGAVCSCILEDEYETGYLAGTDFYGANLEKANLNDSNLNKADFSDSILQTAFLNKAFLVNSNLKNANLTDASLELSDLGNADLRHANLTNANLRYANLRGAQFDGAVVKDAIFEGVKNLDETQKEYLIRNGARGLENNPVNKAFPEPQTT